MRLKEETYTAYITNADEPFTRPYVFYLKKEKFQAKRKRSVREAMQGLLGQPIYTVDLKEKGVKTAAVTIYRQGTPNMMCDYFTVAI